MNWWQNLYAKTKPSDEQKAKYHKRAQRLYLSVNRSTGGLLGVVRHAVNNFTIARGAEASAGLGYYAMFSIFPILLVIVTIASFFLEQDVVKATLLEAVTSFIPVSAATINQLFNDVLAARGAATLLALVSLVWSASNVFDKVIINVNRAFPQERKPGFLQTRVMAIAMILLLFLLFVLSLFVNTLFSLIPWLDLSIGGKPLTETPAWGWIAWALPLVIKFLLFWGVYTWLPRYVSVKPQARIIGAVVAAVFWELATRSLTWALGSGFANYTLVYGSLGSIMALMFWIYLTSFILFFGAHLVNAINYHAVNRKREDPMMDLETYQPGMDE